MAEEKIESRRSYRSAFDFVVGVVLLAAAGVVIWTSIDRDGVSNKSIERPEAALPADPVSLDGAVLRGSRTAAVGILVYSDFECPACASFANETLPQILEAYVDAGKVLLAFRHFPIEQMHPQATPAAALAACADRQGRFWQVHDAIFRLASPIKENDLKRVALATGLDGKDLDNCLDAEGDAEVAQNLATGRDLKVGGTPSFLFGRIDPDGRLRVHLRRTGTASPAAFAKLLDGLVSER